MTKKSKKYNYFKKMTFYLLNKNGNKYKRGLFLNFVFTKKQKIIIMQKYNKR